MRCLPLAALTALSFASPMLAQDAPPAETAPATTSVPACELHVWPAERFSSITQGWLGGGLLDAAIYADKDKDNRSKMATALDRPGQLEALAAMPLTTLLALPESQVITHDEVLDRKTINKIDTRRAASEASCYNEIIVADVFYHKAPIYGRSLKTLFMVRRFGEAKAKPRIYKSWGGNGLKLFPPQEGEDVTAATDELVQVFKANFEEFARNAVQAEQAPKRSR